MGMTGILVIFFSTQLWAKNSNEIINQLVDSYTLSQIELQHNDPRCRDQPSSCFERVCHYSSDCEFSSGRKRIARLCRGVDGRCVDAFCQSNTDCRLGTKLEPMVKHCKGANSICVETACQWGHCSLSRDTQRVTSACKGAFDGFCVEETCNRLDQCSLWSKFKRVVQACRGESD